MKLEDIRGTETTELQAELNKLNKEAFQISFRASAENITNPARRRQVRRTVARIKTVLRERELMQEKKSASSASPASQGAAK